jgi:hypothetical protein
VVICKLPGPKNLSSGVCAGRLLNSENGDNITVPLEFCIESFVWIWAKRRPVPLKMNRTVVMMICKVLFAIYLLIISRFFGLCFGKITIFFWIGDILGVFLGKGGFKGSKVQGFKG